MCSPLKIEHPDRDSATCSCVQMLGITSALAAEFATGVGLKEQWLIAPTPIFISFAVIAIATYIPIFKVSSGSEPELAGCCMQQVCAQCLTSSQVLLSKQEAQVLSGCRVSPGRSPLRTVSSPPRLR